MVKSLNNNDVLLGVFEKFAALPSSVGEVGDKAQRDLLEFVRAGGDRETSEWRVSQILSMVTAFVATYPDVGEGIIVLALDVMEAATEFTQEVREEAEKEEVGV